MKGGVDMKKAYLTRRELAEILGYSVTTLARFKDDFPKYIYSKGQKGKALYPIDEVKKWAKEHAKTEILKTLEG